VNVPFARIAFVIAVAGTAALVAACNSMTSAKDLPPLELAKSVDIPRFMGDWYVIANIPTFLEKGAHSAKDTYELQPDGTIATTFTFRADAFDGPLKNYHSKGFVLGENGAVWGQQYVWPIKADYRVGYLAPDYSQTVITREKRDYVWIMARTPTMSEADLKKLTDFVARQGYDVSKLQRVPQVGM
jgi:apolipoprotein D and lipocalin family protein